MKREHLFEFPLPIFEHEMAERYDATGDFPRMFRVTSSHIHINIKRIRTQNN